MGDRIRSFRDFSGVRLGLLWLLGLKDERLKVKGQRSKVKGYQTKVPKRAVGKGLKT